MTKEKFDELANMFANQGIFRKSKVLTMLQEYRGFIELNNGFDTLYPPSLEALKAEPWKWLIADPRDPRAQELIGKKVFGMDNTDYDSFNEPYTFNSVTIGPYYPFNTSRCLFAFILPAPIEEKEHRK